MALYNFKCLNCQKAIRKLMSVEEYRKAAVNCDSCGEPAARDLRGPTSRTMEVLDNGLMPRPVERLAETERIMTERATMHSRPHIDDQYD
jgi:DNA-directed RNA polymerase subunit RPC12/RpoP